MNNSSIIRNMNAQNGVYRVLIVLWWLLWPLSAVLALFILFLPNAGSQYASLAPAAVTFFAMSESYLKRDAMRVGLDHNPTDEVINWLVALFIPYGVSATVMSYVGAPDSLEWLWIAGAAISCVAVVYVVRWIALGFSKN